MAEDVRKTIAFLAAFADELVSMQKQTLEALVKSNRAKQVKEWNAAKNFWYRKADSLEADERKVLDDWEFALCDMSYLQPVAFLPRLQRCLDRSGSFLIQHAESMKEIGAKTLQQVLQSRQMKDESMAVFIRVLLERYTDQFTAEQKELVLQWESELCVKGGVTFLSAMQSDVAGRMAEDVCKTIAFLAAFADELVSMQKQTLEALVKSNRAKQVKEWNAAKNFWYRKADSLEADERKVLDDWEFALCDMSYLQPVAFLPRLQRCLDRSGSFLIQHAESMKEIGTQSIYMFTFPFAPHVLQLDSRLIHWDYQDEAYEQS